MSDDLVTIATLPNTIAAEIERNRLLSVGIPAVIDTSASLGSAYGNFVGGVRLLVRQADAEQAAAILDESDPTDDPEESARHEEDPPASVDDPRFKETVETIEDADREAQASNPYRPPSAPVSAISPVDDDDPPPDDELESLRLEASVDRLFRLSVLGWCFPIMAPAHLVVIWLAADLKEHRGCLSDRHRSRLAWASRLSWGAVLLAAAIAVFFALAIGFAPYVFLN